MADEAKEQQQQQPTEQKEQDDIEEDDEEVGSSEEKEQTNEGDRPNPSLGRVPPRWAGRKNRTYFEDIRSIWGAYSSGTAIGQKVFRPHLADQVKHDVLQSPAVREALNRYREASSPSIPAKKAEQIVENMIERLAADFKYVLVHHLIF